MIEVTMPKRRPSSAMQLQMHRRKAQTLFAMQELAKALVGTVMLLAGIASFAIILTLMAG